jgi:RimJ/RimL family protein N-acetyltransferase
MGEILQTERLRLREFRIGDASFMVELMNSEPWLQYIGDRGIKTISQAEKYLLEGPIRSYEVNGFGLSLVELKGQQVPVGACGLLKREHLPHPDIGFAFLPSQVGKGYAFEVASATMKHAAKNLGVITVLAITTADNVRSLKLLKKLGMRFDKQIQFPDGNEEMMLFTNEG